MADGFNRVTEDSLKTAEGIADINRMLETLFNLVAGDGQDQRVYSGYGVPTIAATTGSIYLRSDGSTNTTLYVREGSSWVAK